MPTTKMSLVPSAMDVASYPALYMQCSGSHRLSKRHITAGKIHRVQLSHLHVIFAGVLDHKIVFILWI